MVCPLSRWCVCRGHVFFSHTLFLFQAPEKVWQLEFLVSLYHLDPELAPRCMHAVIFSPMQFLCILLLQEMHPSVGIAERVPDPSLSHNQFP